MHSGCKYTPWRKAKGHPEEVRKQAFETYMDGMNLRGIGHDLGIHHRTVSLGVKAHAESLPEVPVPEEVKTAEMAELFTLSVT
jgi:hypothetical protein